MTIKIGKHSKYAIDLLIAELKAVDQKATTNDDAIWFLIRECKPDIGRRVEDTLGKRIPGTWGQPKDRQ